ncbi:hypothetical protein BGI05_01295 [Snodgrassella alvi]|uniref:hypothetical protein n=1 Tax=Snodgrassella alvi TaxID=1196083 RepID=UPI0009FD565F|nr:hypothetical protein [Snodgrassella alvi]ORF04730.1 hypothetical protein BGH97_00325 [Snodgrassella alvi]ORF09606.1 hypothetical protein BGH99_01770 [Snodgrassella alvi]ORF14293.1 hypothetical protein BGI02_05375 [Snodgrassella alvi]ORF15599.1 hypothetical protein BGI00_00490 [Snodgrassella alvi]ORF22729.1 hypothetical protein BGI05_01295 [Snodgrassella alvi]
MIGNYKNEPDKYLYGVCPYGDKNPYGNICHDTIKQAIDAAPLSKENLPTKLQIAIFKKGDLFKPSECNAFTEDAIKDLLDKSNEMLCPEYFYDAELFKLTPAKLKKLKNIINDYLDKWIDTTGCQKVGELLEVITLTREQYTKYL